MSRNNDQGAQSHHNYSHLSVSDHIRDVISKCSQSMHALKVVTAWTTKRYGKSIQSSSRRQASVRIASLVGVCDGSRQTARRGVYSARSSTRTVPGWRPNDNATYRQELRQSLQQPTYQRTPRQLKQLLPDKTNYHYSLRNRRHNLSLVVNG